MSERYPWVEAYGSVEWYTPPALVARITQALGGRIDVDPCSPPPPYPVPATLHYTAAENGLYRPWPGTVYCNPPYDGIAPWLATLAWSIARGHTTAAIVLVPGSFDCAWFAPLWSADALCFHRGRIKFLATGRDQPVRNPLPSVLAYWGGNVPAFRATFAPVGRIITP